MVFACALKGIAVIEKPILDKKEKEYLSAVIKPFRDRVVGIFKFSGEEGEEFIEIVVRKSRSERHVDGTILPFFDEGTMYKGMKLEKRYTLEDLGL